MAGEREGKTRETAVQILGPFSSMPQDHDDRVIRQREEVMIGLGGATKQRHAGGGRVLSRPSKQDGNKSTQSLWAGCELRVALQVSLLHVTLGPWGREKAWGETCPVRQQHCSCRLCSNARTTTITMCLPPSLWEKIA